jgi:hypothetical protein
MKFEEYEEQYKTHFSTMSLTADGLRFLKIRTLVDLEPLRSSASLRRFLKLDAERVKRTELASLRKQLFNDPLVTSKNLDDLLREAYSEMVAMSPVNISSLRTALEIISQSGDEYWSAWNSVYRDDIRQHIQHHFVRTASIQSYEKLMEKVDSLLSPVIKGYVAISWYNQWSSAIIERMILSHPEVIPTARRIDKVDFFFREIPIDLKVTFLPNEYLRRLLREGMVSQPSDAVKFLAENRLHLAKWLYENQGEPRFSDSHRLFVTLVDVNNMDNSWKLKASFGLIEAKVNEYLNSTQRMPMLDWSFHGDKISGDFRTHTDVLLIANI